MIDAVEAQRLVEAVKDCQGQSLAWSEVRSPISHVVVRRHLEVVVTTEPPPSVGELLIVGRWTGDDHAQLFLRHVQGKGERNLMRLCLDPAHADDLHWHWYDQVPGPRHDRESVSYPPGMITPVEDFMLEEFIHRMNLTNIAEPML